DAGAAAPAQPARLDLVGEPLRVELPVLDDGLERRVAAVVLVDLQVVEVPDGRQQHALVGAPVARVRLAGEEGGGGGHGPARRSATEIRASGACSGATVPSGPNVVLVR